MKTLRQLKTHTEQNCQRILIATVVNPHGSQVTIGPCANDHELERAINRSGYPTGEDKVETYEVLVPYHKDANRPRVTNEPATVAG